MTRLAFPFTVVVLTVTTTVACATVLSLGGGELTPSATPRAELTTVPAAEPLPALERASRSRARTVVSQPAVRTKASAVRAPAGVPVVRARHLAARATGTGERRAMWDRLVACEAPDRGWRYGAPGVGIDAGYHFFGGPNFMQGTWEAYGGLAFAYRAYDATRTEQIIVAERVLAAEGVNSWPVCGPQIGLHR